MTTCCPSVLRAWCAPGTEITLVTWGAMVERCEQAAAAQSHVDAEVLDLRTLSPWDKAAVLASVHKTRRCLIVHEDNLTAGFGAEIAALLGAGVLLQSGCTDRTARDARYTQSPQPGTARGGRAERRAHHRAACSGWRACECAGRARGTRAGGADRGHALAAAALAEAGGRGGKRERAADRDRDRQGHRRGRRARGGRAAARSSSRSRRRSHPGNCSARIEARRRARREPRRLLLSVTAARAGGRTPPPARDGAAPAGRLSPAVRRLLAEHGLEAAHVPAADLLGASWWRMCSRRRRRARGGAGMAAQRRPPPKRGARACAARAAHGGAASRIAEHMVQSLLHTAPHVTTRIRGRHERGARAPRARSREAFAREGVPLTLTAYFVQAAVAAIRAVPEANSRWTDSALEIYEAMHIGHRNRGGRHRASSCRCCAMRGARDLFETARGLEDLVQRARAGRLSPADVRGGTFTHLQPRRQRQPVWRRRSSSTSRSRRFSASASSSGARWWWRRAASRPSWCSRAVT